MLRVLGHRKRVLGVLRLRRCNLVQHMPDTYGQHDPYLILAIFRVLAARCRITLAGTLILIGGLLDGLHLPRRQLLRA